MRVRGQAPGRWLRGRPSGASGSLPQCRPPGGVERSFVIADSVHPGWRAVVRETNTCVGTRLKEYFRGGLGSTDFSTPKSSALMLSRQMVAALRRVVPAASLFTFCRDSSPPKERGAEKCADRWSGRLAAQASPCEWVINWRKGRVRARARFAGRSALECR